MPQSEAVFIHHCAEVIGADGSLDPRNLCNVALKVYRRHSEEIDRADDALLAARTRYVALMEEMEVLSADLTSKNHVVEAVLDNLPLGFSIFDKNQQLTICNDRFRDLFNLDSADVLTGTSISKLVEMIPGRERIVQPTRRSDARLPVTLDRTKIRRREWLMDDGRHIESTVTILPDGGSVSIHEDVTEERRAARHLAYIAHHDPLTGLSNRVRFREELDRALDGSGVTKQFALIHLDLDNFKSINNTLGLQAGDQVLQQVASRLRGTLGQRGMLARLGSDEFAILHHGWQEPRAIRMLVDEISRDMEPPFLLGGCGVELSVSAGIAVYPEDGSEAGVLLKNASVALSQAKAEGRPRHRFFAAEMEAGIRQRHALEDALRHAVKNEEFELHYQPLYDVALDRIVGFEALLRWNHPVKGRMSPLEFIPLAEEIGLITDIGRWVLAQACKDAASWPSTIKVAVNVSAIQFRTGDFPSDVMAAVAAAGLSPSRLEIEITESVLMQHLEETVPALHALRNRGIRIAMDDFGTGYSSLSYLRSFPFQKIKIDRSFVNDIIDSREAHAILRAMILLGKTLGMRVTAEGVETEEQFEMLRQEGCDEIQGYFISPPKPVTEVARLLSSPVPQSAIPKRA